MWFVYALHSMRDGWLYIGMSSDVEKRVTEHNRGYNWSTRHRRPFELFYAEKYSSREEARKREKFLKTGEGREYLRSRLSGK